MASPELTADALFEGGLTVYQEKRGYRFSIDSVLLAHFAQAGGAASLLDLGCGCGVMPLIVAHRHPGVARLVGVELQPALAALAKRNSEENGFSRSLTIYQADLRQCDAPYVDGGFDVVVSNPPYTPLGRGRLNPQDQKAIARHEVALSLVQLLRAASLNLAPAGTFHMVFPAERLDETMAAAGEQGLCPTRLRMVSSHAGVSPRRFLLSLEKAPALLRTLPPLVVHERGGGFTPEVARMFENRAGGCQT